MVLPVGVLLGLLLIGSPALAYPGADTTVDETCEATLEGLIDTGAGTWSGSLVMICDVHDDLTDSITILMALLVFAIGFSIVTVALR